MDCKHCGYCWADLDEDGVPISLEYCHFDGPDGWAPCEYEDEVEEENLYDDEDIEFERYEDWIDSETQRELDEEPDCYWDWALSGDYDEINDETLEAINDIK